MSAHLLPVTVAWMARLPSGVLVDDGKRLERLHGKTPVLVDGDMFEGLPDLCMLDLSDTLTAAAVAARIVRPWLPDPGTAWLANARWHAGGLSAWNLVERAERMLDMTPIQIDTLTRLARAAMDAT